MFRLYAMALAVTLLCAGTPASAVVLYVDDDAPPGGNGFSWATAFTHLRTALDMSSHGPTEIRIAQGTYQPDRSPLNPDGTGDRGDRFRLNDGVVVRGGYAGIGAPDPDARDIQLYETVLSGDLAGDDQPGFKGMDENSYKVVYLYHAGVDTLLEGVTVRGGNANRTAIPFDLRGGGLYVLGGAPTISHCTVTANCAGQSGSPEGNGAGMYIVTGTPYVQHCRFFRNRALGGGGGIYVNQTGAEISDCTFEENAAGNGGGLESFAGSTTVIRCQFARNTATQNGGGLNVTGGTATIIDCLLEDNVTPNHGGGMYVRGAVTASTCRFIRNEAPYGAGVHNTGSGASGSELTLVSCLLVNNVGAGVSNWPASSPDLVHASLQNCTLAGNGVGLIDYASVLPSDVTSCILWENGSGTESDQLNGSSFAINYSCVQGWSGLHGGTGNFSDNPEFVDLNAGDCHLTASSPCIDAGDPGLLPNPEETDIDGDMRVSDGDGDTVERVDVGADEYVAEICGDLNFDGGVDYDDYVMFLDAFGGPVDGNPPFDNLCDFDQSGAVGMMDYAAWLDCYRDFIGNPLAGPPAHPNNPGYSSSIPGGIRPAQPAATDRLRTNKVQLP